MQAPQKEKMIVIKSKNSGFCFGVKRAINAAYSLKGNNNYILGEIIHNEIVNEKLKNAGIKTITSLDEENLSCGDTLLIRTHGEPEETFNIAAEKKLNVIDCTCPFVKDIQKIVKNHSDNGYKIVIIGNPNHPEVKGINGWCGNGALITENADDISALPDDKICIVVQTTYSEEKFNSIIKKIKKSPSKTVDIFKTICYTTTKRQKEADFLSKECDAVIVIGGANSNNTQKLFDICKKNCKNVFRIIYPNLFDYEKIKNFIKVGVVFGASTPIEQFQEVIQGMEKVTEEVITSETNENNEVVSENVVEVASESDQEQAAVAPEKGKKVEKSEMAKAFESIRPNKDYKVGQIVAATISSVNETGLTISLKNTKKDFDVSNDELLSANKEDYKIGADIRVMVIGKSPVRFSEKAMQKVLAEEADVKEIAEGKIFEVVIDATNKGGLTGKYGSYQVFVPASQIKTGFVKDLEKYVGKKLRLKAEKVESKGARRQIVGSQRVILQAEKEARDAIKAEKEAEFFENIQEGDVVLGTPVRFASFGAFIEVNGFDCFAHISDLSWTGCKECSDVLELNKEYEFIILKIDQEKKRVSLGYKQLQPRPWDTINERYKVGDVIKGKVVRIVKFGAFIEVEKGIDGLVHISQISNKWLENPVSALQVGQEVEAKIMAIDPEKEKLTLSIKELLSEEAPAETSENGKGKKGAAKKEDNEVFDLREWKDNDNGGVSIAEMLGSDK